jgi:YfiH family protein
MTLPAPDPAFRWSAEPWGAALRCRPLEAIAQHLFTTRQLELRPGGRPVVDAALNGPSRLSPSPLSADEGWQQAAASVGATAAQVMRLKQVHGRTVRVLRRGAVTTADAAERPEADAQVSDDPDVVLAVQVADCVPLLMADPVRGVAAAVHAGWRGTAAAIASAAIETMAREFGSRPADLVAAIGPSIGACCYGVGEELLDAFADRASARDRQRWFARDDSGRLRLDLWMANRDQLVAAGVAADRIATAGLCTQTHVAVLESYRVSGASAGRMAGLIRPPRR